MGKDRGGADELGAILRAEMAARSKSGKRDGAVVGKVRGVTAPGRPKKKKNE